MALEATASNQLRAWLVIAGFLDTCGSLGSLPQAKCSKDETAQPEHLPLLAWQPVASPRLSGESFPKEVGRFWTPERYTGHLLACASP